MTVRARRLSACAVVLSFGYVTACQTRDLNEEGSETKSNVNGPQAATAVPLSAIFSQPQRAADGTPYVTVISPDVAVFSYTNRPLTAGSAWGQVEFSSGKGAKTLANVRERLRNGSLKSKQEAEEEMLKAGDGAVAGPGLYVAPDAFVSQEYGNFLIVSCLTKGTKVALDAIDLVGPKSEKSLASEVPVVAYQWYKGIALVIRDQKALAKVSTLALGNNNPDVDPSLVKFAVENQGVACGPVKTVLTQWKKHGFDPKALAFDVFGPSLSQTVALRRVMKSRINRYLMSWPTHANVGGEDVGFASKSEGTVVQCLKEMLNRREAESLRELPRHEELLDGVCPWGREFASYLNKLGDFDVTPVSADFTTLRAAAKPVLALELAAADKSLKADSGVLKTELESLLKRESHLVSWLLFGGHPDFRTLPSQVEQASFSRLFEFGSSSR